MPVKSNQMTGTPVARVVEKFGGYTAFRKALAKAGYSVDMASIRRWNNPVGVNRGSGGFFPTRAIPFVVKAAKQGKIPLTTFDFSPSLPSIPNNE
jgi:hypothetical protein